MSIDLKGMRPLSTRPPPWRFLLWYIALGAVHECVHLLTAILLMGGRLEDLSSQSRTAFLFNVMFGRQCQIEADETHAIVIRHAGWIVSVLIAVCLHRCKTNLREAAWIVAIEGITSDLFLLSPLLPLGILSTPRTFFCGNFGILLLHHTWLTCKEGEEAALSVLRQMISITMMRGAQSGGVLTYKNGIGVRSRVVNKKRTDLSLLLTNKVRTNVFSKCTTHSKPATFQPTFLAGHTRFATSSKSTLEGTHPQRWTTPTYRRVYDLSKGNGHYVNPTLVLVENYVTHNGDFNFYEIDGTTYELETCQEWLECVTHQKMPATVDSCAVAGFVDLLRTAGCFGLSARHALCFEMHNKMETNIEFPSYNHLEQVGMIFESVLQEMLESTNIETISERNDIRSSFALRVHSIVQARHDSLVQPLEPFLHLDDESGNSLMEFCLATINAFFDNDLMFTTKTFLRHAKGTFGLCFNSSIDAHRQICLAARGQTMSVAFYPKQGLICYGSEQAAVKAGMELEFPLPFAEVLEKSRFDVDDDALRLDLDDLGGEVCLLDWGECKFGIPPTSKPNSSLNHFRLMNEAVTVVLAQESKMSPQSDIIYHRMTRLTRNCFVKPLQRVQDDPVLRDIADIPRVCRAIQEDWRYTSKITSSLNRLTAWNLSRCLRDKLEVHVAGTTFRNGVDILLTGCEVSLWLAEQFASDLQKAFPNLCIEAISSNKLLGLYGQEIAIPATGFDHSPKTRRLHDAIVIIVSHSGGTFAPLACASLFQSKTKNLFVVTSEWDTQIGKQLRLLNEDHHVLPMFNCRIFTTEVGIRPAEPCSVSVAATHEMLTQLFKHISATILSDGRFRRATGAVVTEQDLQILEKCDQSNVAALEKIVGYDSHYASPLSERGADSTTDKYLRAAGDLWAEHVLEIAKAYIMTISYIMGTVISGYPLAYLIAYFAIPDFIAGDGIYLTHAIDAAIYCLLPQINVTILRLIQGRNLRHRMVGRTVVIGDIPWVAQAAEAFLSKLFACSYSIAGLNVHSANPADHFVHRHTHRVVRGTLIACGRPDGRLSALSTAEAAVCLSINQASSIQSLGGTCESITIGHNPFKLPLTHDAIFLERNRPLFLCEQMLIEADIEEENSKPEINRIEVRTRIQRVWSALSENLSLAKQALGSRREMLASSREDALILLLGVSRHRSRRRSSSALVGAYMNFDNDSCRIVPTEEGREEQISVEFVIGAAIQEHKWSDDAQKLFKTLDVDNNGFLGKDEFIAGYLKLNPELAEDLLDQIFDECDLEGSGMLDFAEFLDVMRSPKLESAVKLPPSVRDDRGIIRIEPANEKYFGETIRKYNAGKALTNVDFMLARNQHFDFSQELYESRIASLQRFVAMTVMFHQMGSRVQAFFPRISFGMLGYRVDRTQSIMRIATTASPVSGANVSERMQILHLQERVLHSIHVISVAWLHYKVMKESNRIVRLEIKVSSSENQQKIHCSSSSNPSRRNSY